MRCPRRSRTRVPGAPALPRSPDSSGRDSRRRRRPRRRGSPSPARRTTSSPHPARCAGSCGRACGRRRGYRDRGRPSLLPLPRRLGAAAARPYSEFRTAAFCDWHPTRREMIIGTRFGDAQQLHRVRSPGSDRTQLTFFPDPVSGASYQPTEGRYIVFTKDVGGAEFFQKYRYDVATGEITLLTDGKSRNVGGAWSHKGDRYAYMSTRRNGRDLDLWVVDPSTPPTDRMVLQLQGGGYGPLDWSPDDRTILLAQGVSVNESYLWLVDAASGEKTLLAPPPGSETVAYGDAKFSRDGKGIYLSTDQGSEF